jgi:GH15 family glucan-1,4-alpha-glucosidase
VGLTTRCRPRGTGFSTAPLALVRGDDGAFRCDGLSLWCSGAADLDGEGVTIRMDLRPGMIETAVLMQGEPLTDPRHHGGDLLDTTLAFWREWIEYSRYRGPYQDAVMRSALTLKLLTYAPTGAIVAAPTTSLPEEIGGERNWDYRYCWLRDASLTLYALGVLGYSGEARRFADFLVRRCFREGSAVHIMYSIDGEPYLPERTLDHLDGYAGSRPVRVGNGAYNQMQLDVHGEVLDWALLRVALGYRLLKDETGYLRASADHVGRVWRKPEQGLWETRGGGRDFVHGKAMAWAALDRAIRLFGTKPMWEAARADILAAIRQDGVAGEPPYLVQAFGSGEADAALLQVPMLGMPLDDALLAETVRHVERELGDGDLVYRYKGEDGVSGGEGAFFITSFWLVDALLVVGRGEEARRLFERLLARANDVGLYAEEADVRTGGFLGNFPQAFTHLALISSATLLHLHDMGGAAALRGTHADRARRLVGSTEGLKALLYALRRNRGIRLRSSMRSVLSFG